MLRREGEVFLFGTAMAATPLSAPEPSPRNNRSYAPWTESSGVGAMSGANHLTGRAKQGADVAGNPCRIQAGSPGDRPGMSGLFQVLEYGKGAFRQAVLVRRRTKRHAWRP